MGDVVEIEVEGIGRLRAGNVESHWWRDLVLMDRRDEREVLDRLLKAVRTGESRALVVRGELAWASPHRHVTIADSPAERCQG